GVSKEIAQNLTQILSTEVKRVEGTSVIGRDDLLAMIQLDSDKSMLGCDDDSCMAELGGALGVDKLIVGNVGKLAESYVITLRLINARQAVVDNRVTESFKGEEDQLIRAVRHASRKLLGIETEHQGKIVVTSSQEEAKIHIDNEVRGTLPLPPIDKLLPGRHSVRVSKSGFYDWQGDFYVEPNETTVVWSQLKERPAKWYQKWWVWSAVGGVVAIGATAAVMMIQPDATTSNVSVTMGN
ncbi:PEGA domain-containing protein, partial [Myxococcota bacterium]|nr:PEGA domain-containing protein [Myxococcota bacterium]